jgi:hypothetical protein
MPDWLGLDWWRYVWQPALAGGLIWLATTWKTTTDSRGARDARLDTRQDREIARLDAENEDLRSDLQRMQDLANGAVQYAHDRRHDHVETVSSYRSFRDMVRGFLAGLVPREMVERALAEPAPAMPPKVPPLHEMAPKQPD